MPRKFEVHTENGRFASMQDMLRDAVNKSSIDEVCSKLGISRSPIMHMLRTNSDKNFMRFNNDYIYEFISVLIEMFDYTNEKLPLDAIRKINLKNGGVFLCHGREDKEDVRKIYQALFSQGYQPWLDEVDLVAGQDWRSTIQKAIKKSAVIVICLSKKSIEKTGFVQKEIRIALDAADERPEGSIFMIPVRLQDCDVPDRLSHLHYIDIFEETGFSKLLAAMDHACGLKKHM